MGVEKGSQIVAVGLLLAVSSGHAPCTLLGLGLSLGWAGLGAQCSLGCCWPWHPISVGILCLKLSYFLGAILWHPHCSSP